MTRHRKFLNVGGGIAVGRPKSWQYCSRTLILLAAQTSGLNIATACTRVIMARLVFTSLNTCPVQADKTSNQPFRVAIVRWRERVKLRM